MYRCVQLRILFLHVGLNMRYREVSNVGLMNGGTKTQDICMIEQMETYNFLGECDVSKCACT